MPKRSASSFPLSGTQMLLGAIVLLVIGNVAWYVMADWGRITLHVHAVPLRKVVASFESQGHIRLRTDLDPETPVTLDLDHAPIGLALETLSTVTESRWRLCYLVGPSRRDFLAMLDHWQAGHRDDGWRWISHPAPPLADDPDDGPADPRGDSVTLQPTDGTDVQGLLDKIAFLSDATVVVSQPWNPSVGAVSFEAEVHRAVAKVAGAGHGSNYEVFLLSAHHLRTADQGPMDDGGGRFNFEDADAMLQRRIQSLPADKRAAAKDRLDKERSFRQSLAGLTPEQRRARWLARMSDPVMQEMMMARQEQRDNQMTPDQRQSRAQRYVSNKASVAAGR